MRNRLRARHERQLCACDELLSCIDFRVLFLGLSLDFHYPSLFRA